MSALRTTVLEVEGMTCGSCLRHVDGALRRTPGVVSVEVDIREGTALVRHDAEAAGASELIDVLRAEGYPARTKFE